MASRSSRPTDYLSPPGPSARTDARNVTTLDFWTLQSPTTAPTEELLTNLTWGHVGPGDLWSASLTTESPTPRERPFAPSTCAAIGLGCLGVQSIVVGIALATRSSDATVAAFGGLVMVALTAPSIAAAVTMLRTPVAFFVTVAAATTWASWESWGILNEDASTAAIDVIFAPIVTAAIVGSGKLLEVLWENLSSRP